MDRPLGSKHPKFDNIYPVNYGYMPNTISGDGKELDAYVLGEHRPLEDFEGVVIAVIHSKNYTDDQIRALTEFQEQYFESQIWRK